MIDLAVASFGCTKSEQSLRVVSKIVGAFVLVEQIILVGSDSENIEKMLNYFKFIFTLGLFIPLR